MSKTSGAAETLESSNRDCLCKRVGNFAEFEGKERTESFGLEEIAVEELQMGKRVVERDEEDIAIAFN